MNSIEETLWDYIDGNCTVDEHQAISALIASDAVYCDKYNELLALNNEIAGIELDQPSMGFTYKVMEAVRTETVAVPLKAAINKNVIRALVGVFVVIIASLIVYAFFAIDWSAGNSSQFGNYKVPQLKLPVLSKPEGNFILQAFLFFDAVLLLFFADLYVRKRNAAKEMDILDKL